jgi:ABC-2 type transport system ATP-binding protein
VPVRRQSRSMTDPVAAGAAVRLEGLHKTFGEVKAVRGVDLTVAPGEVLALLGPNAAGKPNKGL